MQSAVPAKRIGLILGILWFVLSLTIIVWGGYEALILAPKDAAQGNVGRIFYWHVPTAMLGLSFPYINCAASLAYLYLRRKNPLAALTADAWAIAAAEVTVVFTTITLVTGMLWGRAVWGIWWTWDWRLTSELLLWLIYVAYLMTRRLSTDGQTATLGAIISVFAAIDVPIVYFSIRWFRTQHPQPVFGGDANSGLDPSMYPAFLWNVLAWFVWGTMILVFRTALERRRQRIQQDAALAALETGIDPFTFRNHHPEAGNAAF